MKDGDGEILRDVCEFNEELRGTGGESNVDNRVKWEFCLLIAMFIWIR
jgi:hypothetical protein